MSADPHIRLTPEQVVWGVRMSLEGSGVSIVDSYIHETGKSVRLHVKIDSFGSFAVQMRFPLHGRATVEDVAFSILRMASEALAQVKSKIDAHPVYQTRIQNPEVVWEGRLP